MLGNIYYVMLRSDYMDDVERDPVLQSFFREGMRITEKATFLGTRSIKYYGSCSIHSLYEWLLY
jgi:hypothetical protein